MRYIICLLFGIFFIFISQGCDIICYDKTEYGFND